MQDGKPGVVQPSGEVYVDADLPPHPPRSRDADVDWIDQLVNHIAEPQGGAVAGRRPWTGVKHGRC